jgi:isopentenyl diphosphate isomerase/L-lactate dehydrogenase-like FMN-dependent dehydrogenase
MKHIEFKIRVFGEEKPWNDGCPTVGKFTTVSSLDSRRVGESLAKLAQFLCLACGADSEDVAAAFAEEFKVLPDSYETAAERAANAACVTLMAGVDDRLATLNQKVNRLSEAMDK